jgi:hypothetical protein
MRARPPASRPTPSDRQSAGVYDVNVLSDPLSVGPNEVRKALAWVAENGEYGLLVEGAALAGPGGVAEVDTSSVKGGVHTLRDSDGNVDRAGQQMTWHVERASTPATKDLQFQTDYRTDVHSEQRGLEQVSYDSYPEAQAANGGLNNIRATSLTNATMKPIWGQLWSISGGLRQGRVTNDDEGELR